MLVRTPQYYRQFTCIADKCIDNCCFGGWQIDIDDETLSKYKDISGSFGEKLRKNIDTENACFKLSNGKCPFLTKNNLCEIYKTLGPDAMGIVCDQFPRFTEYYGSIKETGIGLACEEAARIIFDKDSSFELVSDTTDEEETVGEYDKELGEQLFLIRDKIFRLIDQWEDDASISYILAIILDSFNNIQKMINANDYEAVSTYCNLFDTNIIPNKDSVIMSPHDICKEIWYSYIDLEPINSYWDDLSCRAFGVLYETNVRYSANINDKRLHNMYIRLIKYYLFRYMMKAAFDHDLVGKIKLIISNIIVIGDLYNYRMLGSSAFDYKTFMEIIHIFSRQVEYSEDNIMELYDSFIFSEAYEFKNLMNYLIFLDNRN